MADSRRNQGGRQDESAQTTEPSTGDGQTRRRTTRRSQRDQAPDRSSAGRQFLFIDASADRTTSSEAVRVHVMRESHRSRRERQGSQGGQSRRSTNQDEIVMFDARNPSRPTSVTPPNPTPPSDGGGIQAGVAAVDWARIVRAGVSEASLVSVEELYRLGEGYLRSVRLVQPDVLHMCKDDLLSMCAYLALASLQLASNEQEPANVASVQFEARALELLRRRIADFTLMHTDTTIVAVLILSQLEEVKRNAESALFHLRALQRLVEDIGGLNVLRERNTELCDILLALSFVEVA